MATACRTGRGRALGPRATPGRRRWGHRRWRRRWRRWPGATRHYSHGNVVSTRL